jgi:hypothetical protein
VEDVISFAAGQRLDTITLLIAFGFAIHKEFLVLGREMKNERQRNADEFKREVERADKLEVALQEATLRELHADETNAKMANLVPDLLKLSLQSRDQPSE